MPSAEVKQESMASENADPFQKAMTYLKFKIKNLEQRKCPYCHKDDKSPGSLMANKMFEKTTCGNDVKTQIKRDHAYYYQKNLTAIKEKLDAGLEKQLEVEQVQAASKLPEVAGNITFLEQTLARMQTHHEEHSKLDRQRKQAAKQERLQQDLERVRRILMLQDTLMGIDERVREDLLAGARGAPQLTETALEQIDAIFKLVTPNHDEAEVPFKDQLSNAAEHLLRLADRSQKKINGTTYEALAKTLESVFESGVLSAEGEEEEGGEEQGEEEVLEMEPENGQEGGEYQEEVEVVEEQMIEEVALVPGPAPGSAGDSPPYPQEVLLQAQPQMHPPAVAPVPAPVPAPMPVQAAGPPAGMVPVPMPVPVAAPAPPPQPSINFLQESELLRPADPTAVDPAVVRFSPAEYHAIPSQTFTNTNFAGLPAAAALSELAAVNAVYAGAVVDTTPNPPPPIPMPNHDPAPPPPAVSAPAPAPAPAPPVPAAAPTPTPAPAPAPAPEPAPEVNAWAARQAAAPAPAPAEPAPSAGGSGGTWGDGEGDTEIGQWDGGSTKTWDNGKQDAWENGGDNHWNGTDGRRGGYRGRGGGGSGRSRGPSNGFGGRGRGGYDRPPRSARGGYGEERPPRGERPEGARRGAPAGGERPYRGARGGAGGAGGGGGRGAPRGARGGPPRQQ